MRRLSEIRASRLSKKERRSYLDNCKAYSYDLFAVASSHVFLFAVPVDDEALGKGCLPTFFESDYFGSGGRLYKKLGVIETPLTDKDYENYRDDNIYLGNFSIKSIFRAYDRASPNAKGQKKYNFVTNNCFHFVADVMKRLGATLTEKERDQIVREYSKTDVLARFMKRMVVKSGANTLKFLGIANPKRTSAQDVARAMVQYQFDKYSFVVRS